jgi:hypothetical protein
LRYTDLIGREPDRLSLKEQQIIAGRWIALEIYDPDTQPLKRIVAIGESPADCIRQLSARGLDPLKFEFYMARRPF